MAYANPYDERARASRRRHYERNKAAYIRRARERQRRVDVVCANCHRLLHAGPC